MGQVKTGGIPVVEFVGTREIERSMRKSLELLNVLKREKNESNYYHKE